LKTNLKHQFPHKLADLKKEEEEKTALCQISDFLSVPEITPEPFRIGLLPPTFDSFARQTINKTNENKINYLWNAGFCMKPK